MFNFTEEIKNEIIATPLTSVDQKLSMLSAFIRTSGSFISRGGVFGFEVVTENERTAEFFTDMLEDSFGIDVVISEAKQDILSGRYKLAFECVNEKAQNLLIKLGLVGSDEDGKFMIFGIDENLISTEDKMKAYLKGAFLGGGSCTLPDEESYSRTGYHFEVVFANKATASNFCEILADFDIIARLVARKDNAVVYVKSKEVISDLLNYMDCFSCLEKLDKIVEFKDRQNNENRVNNCSVSRFLSTPRWRSGGCSGKICKPGPILRTTRLWRMCFRSAGRIFACFFASSRIWNTFSWVRISAGLCRLISLSTESSLTHCTASRAASPTAG